MKHNHSFTHSTSFDRDPHILTVVVTIQDAYLLHKVGFKMTEVIRAHDAVTRPEVLLEHLDQLKVPTPVARLDAGHLRHDVRRLDPHAHVSLVAVDEVSQYGPREHRRAALEYVQRVQLAEDVAVVLELHLKHGVRRFEDDLAEELVLGIDLDPDDRVFRVHVEEVHVYFFSRPDHHLQIE